MITRLCVCFCYSLCECLLLNIYSLERLYVVCFYSFMYWVSPSDMRFLSCLCFEQPREPATAAGSSQPHPETRTDAQVANDAKVMAYMKSRVVKLEQDLKSARNELSVLKARPALATQREDYVLGEMELINRQLDCEYDPCSVL